jgi:thiol-disulfide isomerase/thioredoxin
MASLQPLVRALARLVPWAMVGMVLVACGRDGNASPPAAGAKGSGTSGTSAGGSADGGGLGKMLDDIDQTQRAAEQRAAAGDAAAEAAQGGGAAAPKKQKVSYIPGAQAVDIAQYAVAGETTIFDFYSEYCGPCRMISPHLERLDKARADVSVVKVDINRPGVRGIDWGSPVARQYGLQSVPHFKIYGPEGKLVSEGQPAYQQIVNWIQQLGG